MSDAVVSRRGLLAATLSRVRLPDLPAGGAPDCSPRPVVWGRGDSGGLLDGPAARVAELVAHVDDDVPMLVTGTGDPALGRRLRERRGPALTEIHETVPEGLPEGATHAPLSRLPVPDGSFGAVVSACGPMFARSAAAAHAELLRVTAPGGVVVFCAWAGGGAVGRLLRLVSRHDPPAAGRPSALTWGREERLRQDLDALGVPFETDLVEIVTPVPRCGATDVLLRALGAPDVDALPSALRDDARDLIDGLVARVGDDPAPLRSRLLVVRATPVSPASPRGRARPGAAPSAARRARSRAR